MNCYNCGKEINDYDKFCYHCGAGQQASKPNSGTDSKTETDSKIANSAAISFNTLWFASISFILLTISPVVSLIISCFGLSYAKNKACIDKILGKVLNITLICICVLNILLMIVQIFFALKDGASTL